MTQLSINNHPKEKAPRFISLLLITLMVITNTGCERRSESYGGRSEALMDFLDKHTDNPSREPQIAERSDYVQGSSQVLTYATPASITSHDFLPKPGGPDGPGLFVKHCSACHQVTGTGIPGAFPPLDGSLYVTSDNTSRLAAIMLYGLQGPITVKGMTYSGLMTPFRSTLKDDELAAIATHIRNSWSNKADPVKPELFAEIRKKWGERAQFTIQELGLEPGA